MQSSNNGFTPGTLEYSAPEVLLGRFCSGKVGNDRLLLSKHALWHCAQQLSQRGLYPMHLYCSCVRHGLLRYLYSCANMQIQMLQGFFLHSCVAVRFMTVSFSHIHNSCMVNTHFSDSSSVHAGSMLYIVAGPMCNPPYICEQCLFWQLQADVFSYGVILWEIVTHEEPQRGGLRDCRVPQECPAEIDQLINQCLSQEPDDRPTAKDVCEVIRQWRVVKEAKVKQARVSKDV